ncbi:MAG: hypothetical protein ACLTSX_01030 [Collinsella sp.]
MASTSSATGGGARQAHRDVDADNGQRRQAAVLPSRAGHPQLREQGDRRGRARKRRVRRPAAVAPPLRRLLRMEHQLPDDMDVVDADDKVYDFIRAVSKTKKRVDDWNAERRAYRPR